MKRLPKCPFSLSRARLLAAMIAVLATPAGCTTGTRPCREGTLMVTVIFDDGDDSAAHLIDLKVSIDGGAPKANKPLPLEPGMLEGTIEVAFPGPGGYPVDKRVQVDLTVTKENETVGIGTGVIDKMPRGCATMTIRVDRSEPDVVRMRLTGWWRDYPGRPPWSGSASQGTSITHNLIVGAGGDSPSAGASIKGHTGAAFDGLDDRLTGDLETAFFSSSGGATVVVLMQFDSVVDDPGSIWFFQGHLVISSFDSNLGLYLSTAGAMFGGATGVNYESTHAPCAPGPSPHLVQAVYDGKELMVRVDSGNFQQPPLTKTVTLTSEANDLIHVGGNGVGGTRFFKGTIYEIMTADFRLTDPELADIKTYINRRYGLSF